MAGGSVDRLGAIRDACERQDWQGAFDAAGIGPFDEPADEADRLDLQAEAAWWLGRLDACIEAREAAYRAYEELGDHRRAGGCAVWLYEHHAFRGHGAIAGAWLRRARRALVDDPECEEHGALALRELETLHGAGELDRAVELGTSVIELARRLRSADLEGEALQAVGRVLIDRGAVAEGMGHLDEAMLLAVEGRLRPYSAGKIYCSLIAACEDVGDVDRAGEWTDATARWSERHPFAIFPGICRVHRAIVLKHRGQLAEAEEEAARACEELRDSRPVSSAAAWSEVGDIRRRLGELDRAEEAFARARELSGSPCAGLALLRLAQGRPEEARAAIEHCLAGAVNPLARGALLPNAAQVSLAAGDLAGAAEATDELEEIAEAFDLPTLHAAARLTRGRLALARDEVEAARDALRDGLVRWRELDVPYEVATAGTLLGEALRRSGDDAAAAEAFADASRLFDRIGVLDAGTAGEPTSKDPPTVALPGGLTAREVEVLLLVAEGLTNGEIAARLHLSAKTVSRHLSNIFTKIDVSSRAAATAFAYEHRLVDAG